MTKVKILANHLNESIMFDYVDANRVMSRKEVTVNKIEEGVTAGGKHRIWIYAFDRSDNSKPHKTFLAHRILTFIDLKTGECRTDVESYFNTWIQMLGGEAPNFWPKPEENKIRVRNFDLEFNDKNFVLHWFFGVHKAFRPALDILWTSGRSEEGRADHFWTRGHPPQYNFDIGDTFYAPQCVSEEWSIHRQKTRTSLIVLGFSNKPSHEEKMLVIEKNEYADGKIVHTEEVEVSQLEFSNILKVGFG